MKTGFSFKGRHSSEFGVTAQTKSRPILPDKKRLTFEPDAYDGVIDVSAYNARGRVMYEERVFQIKIMITANDIFKLQTVITRLIAWLDGSGLLIFDDIPNVAWDASVITAVDYMPQRAGQKAELDVSFTVKPFSHALFDTANGIPLDSKIQLCTKNVPIGLSECLTRTIDPATYYSVVVIFINNIGTAPVQPLITLTDNTVTSESDSVTVQLQCNDKTIKYILPKYCQSITFDTASAQQKSVSFLSGHRPMNRNAEIVIYEPFELNPGYNAIYIRTTSQNLTIRFDYTPLFVYSWEVTDS